MLREDSSNPYITEPEVQVENLIDRQEIFNFAHDALLARHPNVVVPYGQHRVGKTSILKEIPNRLPVTSSTSPVLICPARLPYR